MAYVRGKPGTRRVVAACLLTGLAAGCSSMISHNPGAIDASVSRVSTLLPNQTLQLTPSVGLSVENALLGAGILWIVDPLAPNWQLEQAPLGSDRYRIYLRKKRFTTGGDGEAAQVFARRAGEVVRERGFAGYTVVEYTEGIESTLPLAQRVAQGVIQLNR